MKILMVNLFYYPYLGGTEKHIREISKELVRKGHDVTVLCAEFEGMPNREVFEGIKIIRTKTRMFNHLPHPLPPPYPLMTRFYKEFVELLKKEKFDIIHIHNRFVFGVEVVEFAKKYGAKVVLTLHNSRTENIDWITDKVGQLYDDYWGQRVMRKCDGIIGVSRNTLERTVPKDYSGKTEVIYNGCDHKKSKIGKGRNWEKFFKEQGYAGKMILTNTRLVKQKGLEYLIKAVSKIRGTYLVILGRGPLEKELRQFAKRINSNVFFLTEKIAEENLVELYSNAHIFALSSLYEPCAVALMEAQALGLATVATSAGGNPEIVLEGKTGLLAAPKDPGDLAKKISHLLKNEKMCTEFSKNAIKRAEKFRWSIAARKTEEFYKRVLEG